MGRMPTHHKGKRIIERVPFTMGGEIMMAISTANTIFPDTTFSHQEPAPFEVHAVIIRATTFDINGDMIEPQNTTLPRSYQVMVEDRSTSIPLTARFNRVFDLGKADEQESCFDQPHTIEKSGGLRVAVTTGNFIVLSVPAATVVVRVRIEVTFLGYKLMLAEKKKRGDQS
jgi:hypothetical protein